MLQPMALDRWSLVTIHANSSRCSIGLPHEGAYFVCKSCRYRQAEFMQMNWSAALKPHL